MSSYLVGSLGTTDALASVFSDASLLESLLHVEAGKESFRDNPKANALLTREYRKPFVVPSEMEI